MIPAEGHAGTSRRLVFATRNEGKVIEMLALLESSRWAVERLPEDVGEYEETGDTFAENARGKALFAAAVLPVPVLADDSGLQIDALGGEPGVRSARWLDASMSQGERNRAVLHRLRDTPTELRTARFVCHLALAYGSDIVHETTGVCEGTIAPEPRGVGGFGYDPIFVVPELGVTFAEIGRDQKSARSHRGRAVRAMADFLRSWQPEKGPRAT
jgi:XTP/dITP diphosphohydrolase